VARLASHPVTAAGNERNRRLRERGHEENDMPKIQDSALAFVFMALACGGSGWRPGVPEPERPAVTASPEAADTLARFEQRDPGLRRFIDQAHGIAIFPTVGKGAIAIGGAHGKGEVYEAGQLVGTARLTQLSLGLALGGQSYSQLIFFEDQATLDEFKSGNFELGAQASAVAVTAGASAEASYDRGVAVFTLPKAGLMYEVAVAGQKFGFSPL
jgi:lipid-binding SYLF domain-containing protein